MTTVQATIDRVERLLLAGDRDAVNELADNIADTTTTAVTLTHDLGTLRDRSVIEVGTEQMLVWTATATNKSATVRRGYRGTTATTHTAGDLVRVDPRFPHSEALEVVGDEIDDLSANGLFQVSAVELTYQSTRDTYNLTGVTSIQQILDVRVDTSGPDNRWPDITRHATLLRNANTTDFASGFAVKFDRVLEAGRTVRVLYAQPFTRPTATTDDLTSTCGLPATCDDIVYLGVAARLMAFREPKRSFIEKQGDSRRAEEVGQGGAIRSASALLFQRDERIKDEVQRLRRDYPDRRR